MIESKSNKKSRLENTSKKILSIKFYGVLDKGEVAHEEKHLEDGADCVQDNQARKMHSHVCIIDQKYDSTHLPFSKDHRVHDDFLKAKHETDTKECIGEVEALCIVYTNDGIIISNFKMLHDQNTVFDRGKDLFSLLGGQGPPYFTMHQY